MADHQVHSLYLQQDVRGEPACFQSIKLKAERNPVVQRQEAHVMGEQINPPAILSPKQAAIYLGIGLKKLIELSDSGEIPFFVHDPEELKSRRRIRRNYTINKLNEYIAGRFNKTATAMHQSRLKI